MTVVRILIYVIFVSSTSVSWSLGHEASSWAASTAPLAGEGTRVTRVGFFHITNGYFTALHGYASVSLAAVAGETPAYP